DAADGHPERFSHCRIVGAVGLRDDAQQRAAALRQPPEMPPQGTVPLVGKQLVARPGTGIWRQLQPLRTIRCLPAGQLPPSPPPAAGPGPPPSRGPPAPPRV